MEETINRNNTTYVISGLNMLLTAGVSDVTIYLIDIMILFQRHMWESSYYNRCSCYCVG